MKNKHIQIKLLLCVALLLFSAKITFSQKLKMTHGPIIQHLTTNSVVINWSTSINSVAWIEYYEEDGSNFYQKERKKAFNSTAGIKNIECEVIKLLYPDFSQVCLTPKGINQSLRKIPLITHFHLTRCTFLCLETKKSTKRKFKTKKN